MIGLVIVTHGRLAEEFRLAMEHVVGPQPDVVAVCIGPDDDMEQRRTDILTAAETVNSGNGVILLTDMFGGTPSNLAISVMEQTGARAQVLAKLVRLPWLRHCRPDKRGSLKSWVDDASWDDMAQHSQLRRDLVQQPGLDCHQSPQGRACCLDSLCFINHCGNQCGPMRAQSLQCLRVQLDPVRPHSAMAHKLASASAHPRDDDTKVACQAGAEPQSTKVKTKPEVGDTPAVWAVARQLKHQTQRPRPAQANNMGYEGHAVSSKEGCAQVSEHVFVQALSGQTAMCTRQQTHMLLEADLATAPSSCPSNPPCN